MKILVLQLARLGDVLITYPTLKALKRQFPDSELHLMVREKFKAATPMAPFVDHTWTMDTRHLLEPLFAEPLSVDQAYERAGTWVERLKAYNWDVIINLSFSPFSSHLVSALRVDSTRVFGFDRHADESLAVSDDASRYFLAQVGLGKSNRLHLVDVFAQVAGVDLEAGDLCQENLPGAGTATQSPYLAVHVGASTEHKQYDANRWGLCLKEVLGAEPGLRVVLLGSLPELAKAHRIASFLDETRVDNLVGQTKFEDLFAIIQNSRLFVGCDSAPLHVADWVGRASLNLSFSGVRFWETGPYTIGSRVLWADSPDELASDRVALEILNALRGQSPQEQVYFSQAPSPERYAAVEKELSWELIQALYFSWSGEAKALELRFSASELKALHEILQICEMALEQLARLSKNFEDRVAHQILGQVDALLETIVRLCPRLRPIVDWKFAECASIPPGSHEEILAQTERVLGQLKSWMTNLVSQLSQVDTPMEGKNGDTDVVGAGA